MMDGGGGYTLYNEDFLTGAGRVADGSVDLVIADPPYGLGKDYGNDSDKRRPGGEFWGRRLAVTPGI